MALSSDRWKVISPSEYQWEREALDYIRENLPDNEIYRAWTNFEFISDDGSINEVDLLIVTPCGFFLVEVKSQPGSLSGDAMNWVWKTNGKIATEDLDQFRKYLPEFEHYLCDFSVYSDVELKGAAHASCPDIASAYL